MDATELAEARRVEHALEGVSEGLEEPAAADTPPDRTRAFSHLSFARMRTRWTREERSIIEAAKHQADAELMELMGDAYIILNRIYEIVRKPILDSSRNPVLDDYGFPLWQTDGMGAYIEDYGLLTDRQREDFLHQITIRLAVWEVAAAQLWGEAMFAKASWEERFAESFVSTSHIDGKRPTEADRTQNGQLRSREERYLALYMSMRSRQADALVRSMERIAQRFKDMLR